MTTETVAGLLRAIACVEILNGAGARSFATAFHVGGGRLATSRRIFERGHLDRVSTRTGVEVEELQLEGVPRYHLDETVDVALLRVGPSSIGTLDPGPDPPRFVSSRLVGQAALVLGYDASRFAAEPRAVTVAARFESVVDRHTRGRPFFVLSAGVRAGFDGAPVLDGSGRLVGLVSPLPREEGEPATEGHLAALPVHALHEALRYHW